MPKNNHSQKCVKYRVVLETNHVICAINFKVNSSQLELFFMTRYGIIYHKRSILLFWLG